jgi:iron complex outermembrane receptor protein
MLALCGSASALAFPLAGHAQDAEEGAGVPDIIVTATRRTELLKDVAMSVNVATGEQIEKLNIFDAKDVQQLAPGLELTNSTGRNNTTTLRGITFDPDQGTGPAVQVYFNEVPSDAQTVYTAIYDIQQIEVLRGPQGLLRGLSAPAGAITFATRKPSFDDIEGYVQATATTRNGYNVQGGVSLPFSDKVALRVAAVVDGNRLNHVRNVNLDGDRSRSRTESFRATLGLRPTPEFNAYLTYQYLTADNKQYQQVVGSGNNPSYQLFPFFGGVLLPDTTEQSGPALAATDYGAVAEGAFRNQNETHLVNLQMSYDLGPATLSFVGAYQSSKLNITRDLDPANAVPNYIDASTVETPYKVRTGELRLTSNNDEGFGWGVGAFYTKQTGTTVVNQKADSFFFPTSVVSTPLQLGTLPYLPIATNVLVPVDTHTWSFNANARFKSGPFKVEGGIRYSILKSNQTAIITVSSPGSAFAGVPAFNVVQDGVPTALQRRSEKPWTGGVNVSYEITPDINIYAAYGHSFRAGSAGVAVPVGLSDDLIRTNPEKTDSWEIGAKGTVLDRRMNFSVAAFYQKLDGFLSRFTGIYYNCPELFGSCFTSPPAPPINNATDPTNGSFDFNYNGDATIKGVEATIDGRFTRDWDLGISASYVKARYDDALLPCNDFTGTGVPNEPAGVPPRITGTGNVSYCVSNGRLAETPDFNLTANTELRMPMGNLTPYVRALFTYRPGFFSDRVNFDYRDRELLNLFVGLRSEETGWDFNVFARNLLAQNRITNISGGNSQRGTAAGVAYDSGYRLVNVMNPREFGITGSYKF